MSGMYISGCTLPIPEQAHGSLEGYGILVSGLAGQAGIRYIIGKNTVTYFGGLALTELFRSEAGIFLKYF